MTQLQRDSQLATKNGTRLPKFELLFLPPNSGVNDNHFDRGLFLAELDRLTGAEPKNAQDSVLGRLLFLSPHGEEKSSDQARPWSQVSAQQLFGYQLFQAALDPNAAEQADTRFDFSTLKSGVEANLISWINSEQQIKAKVCKDAVILEESKPALKAETKDTSSTEGEKLTEDGSRRRRRRRERPGSTDEPSNEISQVKGSTRLEAKRLRRREGHREARRQTVLTETEYSARRESVQRDMLIRETEGLNQIAVLEDKVLVEHYVARRTQTSMVGSVYMGKVQNVLPSMEAAFVDLGKGRNAVLYAGEVNWDMVGLKGRPRRIEQALKPGDVIMVQVTKDPIGQKGARLTSQITLPGRYLVLVPSGSMTGISRRLPEGERRRLKKLLRKIVPSQYGVIIRTAAEGVSEDQLRSDVKQLIEQWEAIKSKSESSKSAPYLLHGEPELALRVVRDIFNEDFSQLLIQGKDAYQEISKYIQEYAPDLQERIQLWGSNSDIFADHRIDEQLAKGMDRKVWLPSGGYLIIDRTEAMTVIDVNTGKFTGSGGTLEETVTRNNLEAAEEIMRQLRLRDIGGIVVIDFVDMVLESNRDLVLRRLIECLGRDRTRHQVTEVTALGLVQMTRKRVGEGLVEAFSTPCVHCEGRGFIVHHNPVENGDNPAGTRRKKKLASSQPGTEVKSVETPKSVRRSMARVAAAAKNQERRDAIVDQLKDTTTSVTPKDTDRVDSSAKGVEGVGSAAEVSASLSSQERSVQGAGHSAGKSSLHAASKEDLKRGPAEVEDQSVFLGQGDQEAAQEKERKKRRALDSVRAALDAASQLLAKSNQDSGPQAAEDNNSDSQVDHKQHAPRPKRYSDQDRATKGNSGAHKSVTSIPQVAKPEKAKGQAIVIIGANSDWAKKETSPAASGVTQVNQINTKNNKQDSDGDVNPVKAGNGSTFALNHQQNQAGFAADTKASLKALPKRRAATSGMVTPGEGGKGSVITVSGAKPAEKMSLSRLSEVAPAASESQAADISKPAVDNRRVHRAVTSN